MFKVLSSCHGNEITAGKDSVTQTDMNLVTKEIQVFRKVQCHGNVENRLEPP